MFFGGGKNFFSREKKFFPPPNPHLFQEKRSTFAPVGRKTGNTLLQLQKVRSNRWMDCEPRSKLNQGENEGV